MNLKPKEFWDETSPGDILKMCQGFNFRYKRENEKWLLEMKCIRWVGSMIYNTNVKRINQLPPEKLFGLPDFEEEKKEITIPSKEEMEQMKKWI